MMDRHHGWRASIKPPCIGFVISMLLLVSLYSLQDDLSGWPLRWTLLGFAAAQAAIQLFLFLHLGMESTPRWNLISFLFMILVMVVVIGGSLWIMNNLNYNVMPPMESAP